MDRISIGSLVLVQRQNRQRVQRLIYDHRASSPMPNESSQPVDRTTTSNRSKPLVKRPPPRRRPTDGQRKRAKSLRLTVIVNFFADQVLCHCFLFPIPCSLSAVRFTDQSWSRLCTDESDVQVCLVLAGCARWRLPQNSLIASGCRHTGQRRVGAFVYWLLIDERGHKLDAGCTMVRHK